VTHGPDVQALIVPLNDERSAFTAAYLRKPERATVQACLALHAEKRFLDETELLIRDTMIEGDEQILEDDDLFYSAHIAIQGMVRFRIGELKKN
jgi:hypothetical protein